MKIQNQTILITGGGTGIGRALAEKLHSQNNTVIICGRRDNPVKEVADKNPGMHSFRCDISDPKSISSLLKKIKIRDMELSMVINNAAVLNHYHLHEPENLDLEKARYDFNANFFGPVQLIKMILPDLIKKDSPAIINIGSPVGLAPLAKAPFYSASKAALHSYTRSLRYSLKGKVRVIEVFPPVVATDISPKIRKEMQPAVFAEKMLTQIEKGKDEIWIGDGKILRMLERLKPMKVVDIVNDYSE